MSFYPDFFNRLEFLFSSIGVILSFFMGIFLLIKKKNYSKANTFLAIYLLAFSTRIGKSLFHNYYTINDTILTMFLGLFLVIGPCLWLYANNLYKNIHAVKNYLHYIPFFVLLILSNYFQNDGNTNSKIFYLVLIFHGLIYCVYTLYWLFKTENINNHLQKGIQIKRWLALLTLTTLLMFINSLLIFLNVVSFYPSSAVLFSLNIVFLLIWALKNVWLFKTETEKYSNSTLSFKKVNAYLQQLHKLIEKERLYLDPELTLSKLAKIMGVSSKLLSQIINQTENSNYSQFIAKYRVIEVKKRLRNPVYNNYKIAAIAYESGFNSTSSFNASFKKITNTTAVKYRKSCIKNQS